jgi:hypothetical protein
VGADRCFLKEDIMSNKVTPEEIIRLVKSLPDAEHHIYKDSDKHYITQEWLCGAFAGRAFASDTLDEAAQKMIDYLYRHIGHNSIVGDCVTKSGFPDLQKVARYCLDN